MGLLHVCCSNPEMGILTRGATQVKSPSSRLAREALFLLRTIGTHEQRSAKRGVAFASNGAHDVDAGYRVHQRIPNLK
jgi:hypothetical protein